MSDARWTDVEEDLRSSVTHFRMAVALHERGGFLGAALDAYAARMAFMHAMQSGHSSIEAAFVRVMRLLGEDVPQSHDWRADLIRRVSRPIEGRPAMIGAELARAANETRRFRHVGTRSYDSFDPDLAAPSARAAGAVARTLVEDMTAFRRAIEPGR